MKRRASTKPAAESQPAPRVPRYHVETRSDWIPPGWVIVDRATGDSSHYESEEAAREAAQKMNLLSR